MTIVPAAESPELCYLASPTAAPVKIAIVAFAIENGRAEAIVYPAIPRGARVFFKHREGWRRYDLESGICQGAAHGSPAWEE